MTELANKSVELDEIKVTHPLLEMAVMFFRNYAAVAGLLLLIAILLFTFVGPLIHPTDPFEMVWAPFSRPGEEGFLLGSYKQPAFWELA